MLAQLPEPEEAFLSPRGKKILSSHHELKSKDLRIQRYLEATHILNNVDTGIWCGVCNTVTAAVAALLNLSGMSLMGILCMFFINSKIKARKDDFSIVPPAA